MIPVIKDITKLDGFYNNYVNQVWFDNRSAI